MSNHRKYSDDVVALVMKLYDEGKDRFEITRAVREQFPEHDTVKNGQIRSLIFRIRHKRKRQNEPKVIPLDEIAEQDAADGPPISLPGSEWAVPAKYQRVDPDALWWREAS